MADIVLIEDCTEDADLAVRVLGKWVNESRIVVINDGVEAIDYFFHNSSIPLPERVPKVIFLDIKLPRLTGPEVLKRLKTNELTRTIPVVMLTSSNMRQDLLDCYSLGANSYIVKPIDFPTFQSVISNAFMYWLNFNTPAPL